MKFLKGLLINFQFFTSIPIPLSLPMDNEHLEKTIKTFPLLGILQGVFYASLLYLIVEWTPFSMLTAAFVVWLAGVIVTGGIHLDGWLDASDAYFSYQDREKRLEIMSDPRTGAFGVLSVIVLLMAKFFFIYEIVLMHHSISYLLIACIPFFSKMIMGVILLTIPSAKKEGLGSMFQKAAKKGTLLIYPVYVLLLLLFAGIAFENSLIGIVVFIAVSILLLFFLQRKIRHWFGGMTGDVLGASVEGSELVLWMILWLLHYFVMG